MNCEDLGHKLKVERTKLKYNRDDVAYEVGVGQRYLSKIEHGLARPEFEKVLKIAQVLGLSLDYLAGIEYKDNNPDYLTNTINIRLQFLLVVFYVFFINFYTYRKADLFCVRKSACFIGE